MRTKDGASVFRELSEMYAFLRMLQKSRIAGETDEAYRKRQRRIVQKAIYHSFPKGQHPVKA
jgi:hypothetical protein